MAAPQIGSKAGVFGPSSVDLTAAREAERKQQLAEQITAQDAARKNTNSPYASAAGAFGAAFGQGLGGAVADAIAPDPVITRAKNVEAGIQTVDDSFEPDPKLSDLENEAKKLGMYDKSVGHLLSPEQKMALSAQRFAYLNDAFQQSRLKNEDARADKRLNNDLDVAKIDLQIKQQQLDDAKNSAEFGDQKDEAVYALPDGSEVSAPVGSAEWRAYQKQGLEYKGTKSELNQMSLQREKERLQGLTDAQKAARSAYTAKERESFRDLSSTATTLAQILNIDDPNNPNGAFFDNAAGWKGYLDAAKEAFNSFVGEDVFSSASQAGAQLLNKYRVDLQQLIKGIPSDKDQTIVDATRMVRGDSQSRNRDRMNIAIQDVAQRARIAYAEARERVGEGNEKYIPAGILATLRQLGVDPKSVESADAEYQNWNETIYQPAIQMMEKGSMSTRRGDSGKDSTINLDQGPVRLN